MSKLLKKKTGKKIFHIIDYIKIMYKQVDLQFSNLNKYYNINLKFFETIKNLRFGAV